MQPPPIDCHEPPALYRMQAVIETATQLIDNFVALAVVWTEARGEDYPGRAAVLWTLRNRARRLGQPIATVGLDCCNIDVHGMNEQRSSPRLIDLHVEVEMVSTNQTRDWSDGADHFLTVELARRSPPAWYDPSKITTTIGGHVFLRLLAEP